MIDINSCKNLVFVKEYFEDVPYDVMRESLYSPSDLYDVLDMSDESSFDRCYDTRVYHHFIDTGKTEYSAMEALSRSLHDYSIRVALRKFLGQFRSWQAVGIMGGHGMRRTDSEYRDVVLVSKRLTEKGYLMISGGGPGAMEATHLGAWMAGRALSDVDEALHILSAAPTFQDKDWLRSAMRVIRLFPQLGYNSLAIPTWLYGHEPATPFATHIAKMFENSIREETLLTIAHGGLIYVSGSAGTIQEIFQEAVQNHYESTGYASPMVFLGKDFWVNHVPIAPFFKHMVETGRYKNMILTFTDDIDDAIGAIESFKEDEKKCDRGICK
ncbi:MAG: hypothetical protein KBT20_04500 [Bacteroidales bacterium]|nr:hypothetical protein [Candidatus Liminaster caballi]